MIAAAALSRSRTAAESIDTVSAELHTDDRELALRVLRSWPQMTRERLTARFRKSPLIPLLGATAAAALLAAPTAAAVVGSSGAPTSGPAYDPYPCAVIDPLCTYDPYDPGAVFDQSNYGIGRGYVGRGVGYGLF